MAAYIFLNNIRSAHNVGAIFRTAEGAGVEKIYLGGYTPTPVDRFNRPQPEITKTSLGASELVPWEHITSGEEVVTLQRLQADGMTIVTVEQTSEAVSLYDFVVPDNVVYIFGNEVSGVELGLIDIADQCMQIPMAGQKESLNVATTVGIVVFWR